MINLPSVWLTLTMVNLSKFVVCASSWENNFHTPNIKFWLLSHQMSVFVCCYLFWRMLKLNSLLHMAPDNNWGLKKPLQSSGSIFALRFECVCVFFALFTCPLCICSWYYICHRVWWNWGTSRYWRSWWSSCSIWKNRYKGCKSADCFSLYFFLFPPKFPLPPFVW